jgi:hypothetical protein
VLNPLFLNGVSEVYQKRGFLERRNPSNLSLLNCGQKSVSDGVPMRESSVLSGLLIGIQLITVRHQKGCCEDLLIIRA